MSYIGNAIRMAILLRSRGRMKSSELAQELEVGERQIRRYRDDLEQAGIFINAKTGNYGGYELVSNDLIGLGLEDDEITVLEMLNEQLKYNNDLYSKEFEGIVDKLRAYKNQQVDTTAHMSYFTIQPKSNYDTEVEKKKYLDIHSAYLLHRKIKMKYYSLTSGLSERVIHPYGLFHYKGDLYLVAYCEKRKRFIDFKLCRIKAYEILEEKFEVDRTFSWKKYSENTIGIYKDEEIELELKVKHPFSVIISEKVWVENQEIQQFEDGSILFKAKIKGYSEIKSWITSMGSQVEVIAPEKLRLDVKREAEKMLALYASTTSDITLEN